LPVHEAVDFQRLEGWTTVAKPSPGGRDHNFQGEQNKPLVCSQSAGFDTSENSKYTTPLKISAKKLNP
jgi:hypothetical protein